MTTTYIAADGGLDEKAWNEMCATASAAAMRGCGLSDGLYRERFSHSVEARLQTLPQELRARAVELANERGDYATPEELAAEQQWNAENGICTHGIDVNCCPLGCGDIETGPDSGLDYDGPEQWAIDEQLNQVLDEEAHALADSVHFALQAWVQQMESMGVDCAFADEPTMTGEIHRMKITLRPAGARRGDEPCTLEVSAGRNSQLRVNASVALLDEHGELSFPSASTLNAFTWAEALLGAFHRGADAAAADRSVIKRLARLSRAVLSKFPIHRQPNSAA